VEGAGVPFEAFPVCWRGARARARSHALLFLKKPGEAEKGLVGLQNDVLIARNGRETAVRFFQAQSFPSDAMAEVAHRSAYKQFRDGEAAKRDAKKARTASLQAALSGVPVAAHRKMHLRMILHGVKPKDLPDASVLKTEAEWDVFFADLTTRRDRVEATLRAKWNAISDEDKPSGKWACKNSLAMATGACRTRALPPLRFGQPGQPGQCWLWLTRGSQESRRSCWTCSGWRTLTTSACTTPSSSSASVLAPTACLSRLRLSSSSPSKFRLTISSVTTARPPTPRCRSSSLPVRSLSLISILAPPALRPPGLRVLALPPLLCHRSLFRTCGETWSPRVARPGGAETLLHLSAAVCSQRSFLRWLHQ
jgi:hypothetical protein